MNVKALQLLAGHSNIATTIRYVHPDESDVFGIVAAMNAGKSARRLPAKRDSQLLGLQVAALEARIGDVPPLAEAFLFGGMPGSALSKGLAGKGKMGV